MTTPIQNQFRLEEQWTRLNHLVNEKVVVSLSTQSLGADYQALLNVLRNDRWSNGTCMLGMLRAPASKERHHAFEGGLVAHLLEMWDIWEDRVRALVWSYKEGARISDSMVLRAIIHHDLGKVWKYKPIENPDGFLADYGDPREDELSQLLGDTHKAIFLLQNNGVSLTLDLYSALITSHGGYTKEHPRCASVFAKTMYLLDELSANVANRLSEGLYWDSKIGGIDRVT